MSWIDQVMEATSEVESPRQWIWWAAICTLSAIAGPNTYLDKFYYKLSPNLFVMLLGKSGLGKGFPIWMAKELVDRLDCTRVISGRNSVEAVIKELSMTHSRQGKKPLTDARGFLISGEFVNFLIQNPQSLSILTELYDTHYNKVWKNTLKGTGVETLKGTCLTLLGASSPAHYKEAVSDADIEGGFAGRTLHIYEEKRGFINPLTKKPEKPFDVDKLIEHLRDVQVLKGEFVYADGANEVFNKWYYDFRSQQEESEDTTGMDQRLHDHVLKIAMCLSLSRRLDLKIMPDDVNEAIKACQGLVLDVRKATIGFSKEEITRLTGLVIQALLKAPDHKMARSKLLRRLWQRGLNAVNLATIQETLHEAGTIYFRVSGGEQLFILTEDYLKYLEDWKQKKEKKSNESSTD